MRKWNDLPVGIKLGILIVFSFFTVGVIWFSGYTNHKNAVSQMQQMYSEQMVPTSLLMESRAYLNKMNSAVLELMLTTDPKKNEELKGIVEDRTKKIQKNTETVQSLPIDERAAEFLRQLGLIRQQYMASRDKVIALALRNENTAAYDLYVRETDPLSIKYADILRDFASYYTERAASMSTSCCRKNRCMDYDFLFGHALSPWDSGFVYNEKNYRAASPDGCLLQGSGRGGFPGKRTSGCQER